ncbi:hypothetical transcriptional regulatory protein [Mycolicibacterium canariasense]|uniref:Hypothetical transcriptional regulatory protein n=1 Tax=Mycolicibacterium canariasense TaxID=228230 RepID=A0A117ICP2_MYCCR|nr:MarR family transcriptional regulator [Mycolicibacterium canariasense]MCV7207669.1 MarR family transcriptional regulator [Mycolicibacterium canariasense]ORV08882.1 hypothetical protein AWB94_11865 [Mycolicibacterium canariasense]GAS99782.1 hypothetical transcriptional regulatory protein [Mycolicibacterium canariasense]
MPQNNQLLGPLIYRVSARLRAEMSMVLQQFELTLAEFVCLRVLRETPGLTNAELARIFEVTPQTMNTTLAALESAGLVHRPAKAARGRSLPCQVTAAAQRLLDDSMPAVRAAEAKVLAALDTSQRREFRRMLAAIAGQDVSPRAITSR